MVMDVSHRGYTKISTWVDDCCAHESLSDMSDKNHFGQKNIFATQDQWSCKSFGLNLFCTWNLIGQANSQTLSYKAVRSLLLS